MTTAAGYFDRKPSSSIRPGLSHLQPDPSSPHTPQQRTFSSTFSSPSVSYRAEEDALVFGFGARHFSAGFTGESYPRCRLGFGPEESRRVGDYRRWIPGDVEHKKRRRVDEEKWGEEHELWRMDLRGFDLGLVEDKVERAVREAYTKYVLVDPKSRRLMVVIPSVMPHPLLNTLLGTLFGNFSMASITLLSTPVLSTVAAGCRSGLVVDIGWRETTVTGIYEYREVSHSWTTRAMRSVTLEMAKMLTRYDKQQHGSPKHEGPAEDEETKPLDVSLEQAEEVTTRMAWCQPKSATVDRAPDPDSLLQQQRPLTSIAEDSPSDAPPDPPSEPPLDPQIHLPSPSTPRKSIQLPFSQLAQPIESALLSDTQNPDDNEYPLPYLIYTSLLALPPDVRALCMSRIIITGGGSNIPGLKPRLLDEVTSLVDKGGWDPVYGKAADLRRENLQAKKLHRQATALTPSPPTTPTAENPVPIPAHLTPHDPDEISDRLLRSQQKGTKSEVSGIIRGIETLGAWAGASLLANLRIKGIVDIDRDSFLQHGFAGARKEAEINVAPARRISRAGMREKQGWTLGAWA